MRKHVAVALLLASSTLLAQMPAADGGGEMKRTPYYVDPLLLDLSTILPLPPTQESETAKRDLAYVHTIEQTRTPQQVAQAHVPLEGAENARILAWRPSDGGKEHLAIVVGEIDPTEPVLVRLHSECFTGDLLGSLRCDCGLQLRGAITELAKQGSGVLLYLAQEGRGIGLVNKLRAYELQDDGFDTIDANEQLGFDADERIYAPAATMLARMGIKRVRLMTNNPQKIAQLERYGIEVTERVAHSFPANGHNENYLRTKAERAGHLL